MPVFTCRVGWLVSGSGWFHQSSSSCPPEWPFCLSRASGLQHHPGSSPCPFQAHQIPCLSHGPPMPEASPSSLGINARNRIAQSVV